MVDISIENYENMRVYMIPIPNEKLFWIGMTNVQINLGVKSMSGIVRKAIHDIFETKIPEIAN